MALAPVFAAAGGTTEPPPDTTEPPAGTTEPPVGTTGAPVVPSEPLTLSVIDAGGVLSFTEQMFDAFREQHPDLVDEINFEQLPSTEAVPRVQVQQEAGEVSVDLVVSGTDVVGFGIQEGVWQRLFPDQEANLPNAATYTPTALEFRDLGEGFGAPLTVELLGPLLNFDPSRVELPAEVTPQELLAWAEENPGRFTYAAPPTSGPGRDFIMALPWLLGDEDPLDPENGWDNTWAYLAELDEYTAPYPSSTSDSLQALAQQNLDLVVSTVGWDLGMRAEGIHPLEFEVSRFLPEENGELRFLIGGHYAIVPEGLSDERLAVVLQLIDFMLAPEQQVTMYAAQNKAQPGPAVEGVSLADASAETQEVIAETNRPLYTELETAIVEGEIATVPELDAPTLAVALDRWEREIGR